MKKPAKSSPISGPDKNDKLMASLGFVRDLQWDGPSFNTTGKISYWRNSDGLRLITSKKDKANLPELVSCIVRQVRRQTKNNASITFAE